MLDRVGTFCQQGWLWIGAPPLLSRAPRVRTASGEDPGAPSSEGGNMNRRVLAGINVGTHHQVEGATFFALIGSQRCGSNFMRELLGTNPQTIVHGEIFMPFPLPNCWH